MKENHTFYCHLHMLKLFANQLFLYTEQNRLNVFFCNSKGKNVYNILPSHSKPLLLYLCCFPLPFRDC